MKRRCSSSFSGGRSRSPEQLGAKCRGNCTCWGEEHWGSTAESLQDTELIRNCFSEWFNWPASTALDRASWCMHNSDQFFWGMLKKYFCTLCEYFLASELRDLRMIAGRGICCGTTTTLYFDASWNIWDHRSKTSTSMLSPTPSHF